MQRIIDASILAAKLHIRNPLKVINVVDWTPLDDCFSGRIRIGDIEGFVEHRGNTLTIELKEVGTEIPKGQAIYHRALLQQRNSVVVMYHDPLQGSLPVMDSLQILQEFVIKLDTVRKVEWYLFGGGDNLPAKVGTRDNPSIEFLQKMHTYWFEEAHRTPWEIRIKAELEDVIAI